METLVHFWQGNAYWAEYPLLSFSLMLLKFKGHGQFDTYGVIVTQAFCHHDGLYDF